MWDTLINFLDMGIQSFLIFGDNCRIFLKDMGYFLKKLMGYGILGPPFQGLIHCSLHIHLQAITSFMGCARYLFRQKAIKK